MDDLHDCRTCQHNSYLRLGHDIAAEWVSCSHPLTIERGPRWQKGDPAMVNWRTGDVSMRDIEGFRDCPTWEVLSKPVARAAA